MAWVVEKKIMKACTLTTGLVMAILATSFSPMDSRAGGRSQSNGGHLPQDHYRSGIVGQSVLNYGEFCVQIGNPPTPCTDSVPYAATVFVYSEKGELVATVKTDEEGYFQISLEPGNYSLTAYTPPPAGPRVGYVVSAYTSVTVRNKQFASAFVFSASLIF